MLDLLFCVKLLKDVKRNSSPIFKSSFLLSVRYANRHYPDLNYTLAFNMDIFNNSILSIEFASNTHNNGTIPSNIQSAISENLKSNIALQNIIHFTCTKHFRYVLMWKVTFINKFGSTVRNNCAQLTLFQENILNLISLTVPHKSFNRILFYVNTINSKSVLFFYYLKVISV